ncbi:MAG TPA: DNA-formamidopyrimidine glycosylase family protein [Methylomirabilota bacterium]|jgi:endonuclease-8
MPEGDTIHRAATMLHRALAGKTVTRFESVFPALLRIHADTPVTGRRIEGVSATGKHLVIRFGDDLVLRTHMRMNGSWHIYRPSERWHRRRDDMRIVIGTDDFVAVAFTVPVAEFHSERSLARRLGTLGPDLLGADLDADEAVRRLRRHGEEAVGTVMIDQRVMAGAGNIFRCETLFACGVDPFTPVRWLSDAQLHAIVATARRLLARHTVEGRAQGAMGARVGAAGGAGLSVYGRAGAPCRACGTPIAYRKAGPTARSTYWCPRCQPASIIPAGERPAAR